MVQERAFSQTPPDGKFTNVAKGKFTGVGQGTALRGHGETAFQGRSLDSIITPESTGPTGTPGCSLPGLPCLPCVGPSAAPGT